MAWIVWSALGAVVLGSLAVSWWFDRDARRRGAAVRDSGTMWREARGRRWETGRQESQLLQSGGSPKAQDQLREQFRRRPRS